MLIDRKKKNLITEEEAKTLLAALQEKGELLFPLSVIVMGAISGAVFRAQRLGKMYKLPLRVKIIAKLNYSFASIVSFIFWLGATNVQISPEVSPITGKMSLKVKLKSNHEIEWDKLKASAFRSPLI